MQVEGQEAIRVALSQTTDVSDLGLPNTPENLEFVNQVAEAASVGAPLAQPYLDAGAVIVRVQQVAPGIFIQGVGFHHTKFAEMMKQPAQFAN